MATDPFNVGRRSDLQAISEALREVMQALNLGGAARNINQRNVPARYVVYPFRSMAGTFASLPAPSDAGVGARAICTDITDDEVAGDYGTGVISMGGGPHTRPVWSSGVNWHLG